MPKGLQVQYNKELKIEPEPKGLVQLEDYRDLMITLTMTGEISLAPRETKFWKLIGEPKGLLIKCNKVEPEPTGLVWTGQYIDRGVFLKGTGVPRGLLVTRWTKQAFSCSKFLSPGVSFGQIQHLRGLNSIALGYLNFTAGLT